MDLSLKVALLHFTIQMRKNISEKKRKPTTNFLTLLHKYLNNCIYKLTLT